MTASPEVLSFRHLVSEALGRFVEDEGLGGMESAEPLTEVLVSLSRLREEGAALYPQVFLAQQLRQLLATVHARESLRIGGGPWTRDTVRRALKQCAPLGQAGWSIWMEPRGGSVEYGVFYADPSPLTLEPIEQLREGATRSPGEDRPRVVGVRQLAENVVELQGGSGARRYVYLSAARTDLPLPTRVVDELSSVIARDVRPPHGQMVARFYRHLLRGVLQAPHGSLLAVVPAARPWLELFPDGTFLAAPIDVAARVAACSDPADPGAISTLAALVPVMHGMMRVDGITVLRTDGSLVGYHVFILPEPDAPDGLLGGARRRTFRALCKRLGTDLAAAFYCSQDGGADCRVAPEVPLR